MSMTKIVDLSVVLPCLNEAQSVGVCVKQIKNVLRKMRKNGTVGEIIVVDNGSTDRSALVARNAGAIVIPEPHRGYGQAYKTGIADAKGKYIIMGDSDGTYDFNSIPIFIEQLEAGADLVLGSRFKGKINQGAMPFFNRHIGNPLLTSMINIFYGCRISDTQTGFRAFTNQTFKKLGLTSPGMEFASEMIFKSIAYKLKIIEIPIHYHKRIGISKLSPFTDAWRHIQAILLYSPTYAIIFPGLVITLIGLSGTFLLLPGPLHLGKFFIDIHTMTASVLITSLGTYILLIGFFSRIYMIRMLKIEGGPLSHFLIRNITVNRLFISGLIILIMALIPLFIISYSWIIQGFSALAREREFIAAVGLAVIGAQILFSSFLFLLLGNISSNDII
jgi:glycosyltransferase involved in cell wall biosynthesis